MIVSEWEAPSLGIDYSEYFNFLFTSIFFFSVEIYGFII